MPIRIPQKPDDSTASDSNIKVIVVGLGLAGLTTAIECHRKGHSVTILERNANVPTNGDGIGISPNAARIIRQWGEGAVDKRLQNFVCDATFASSWRPDGEFLHNVSFEAFTRGNGYTLHRGTLIHEMYEHAQLQGIDIRLDSSVAHYWETDEAAGVILADGSELSADCVICAEGIHSQGRRIITGQDLEELDPVFSAFRGCIKTQELRQDPKTKWLLEDAKTRDFYRGWTTNGLHLNFFTAQQGEITVWYAAKKATSSQPDPDRRSPKIETAIEWIQDWPFREKLAPILSKAVPGSFIHTKITAHRPLKSWRSPLSRMIVIGDAAHPTPPASAQSGSQAIEDGAVLAITLELAGKNEVPLALEIAEKIRYPRATAVQIQGNAIQDASFENSEARPEERPGWIWDHDCQGYTYREYDRLKEAIDLGRESQTKRHA